MLRAIAHKTKREERREANEASLVSYRYEGSLLRGGRTTADSTTQYIKRVAFIFSQLRRSEKPNLPGVKEYDQVLERVAPSGNMPALTALWAQLSGKTADDFSSRKLGKNLFQDAPAPGVEPSGKTYVHIMLGISRHLAQQIERAHRAHITSNMWKGQGKKKARKQAESAAAVSRGTARYGQEVAPQARVAVQLASARTISLLQDMFERKVKPDKLTLDLALRMLRMDGNLQGIRMLIKGAFSIDLTYPDSDPTITEESKVKQLAPDVHTVNTLVMAFGEQGTISEMISAYETITRPLPTRKVNADISAEKTENLFTTDWRGIFRKDAEGQSGEEGKNTLDEGPKTSVYSHPLAIMPNTTTLTVMIKHCCTAPNPSRMVAVPRNSDSRRAQMNAKDHIAREEGEYVGVASYLLSETIDWQQKETTRIAVQLGVVMPSVESVLAKVIECTKECESKADLPVEMDSYELVGKLTEGSSEPVIVSVNLPNDFVPYFLPPGVTVNFDMIQPISSHASRKRSADFSRWRWLIGETQRSIANKVVELQVLNQGIEQWETASVTADNSRHLSGRALRTFVTALKKQKRMVRNEINNLSTHLVETLLIRFATLRYRRKQKQLQRIIKKEGETMQVEAAKKEVEKRKQKAALQREEARLLEIEAIETGQETQQQERIQMQGMTIPAVEPVYK